MVGYEGEGRGVRGREGEGVGGRLEEMEGGDREGCEVS